LCQELNFASDHLGDIPDREALRKTVEILEAEAVAKTANATANGATGSGSAHASNPPTAKELGETRFALITEAQSVVGLRKMKVAEVVNRAAKGGVHLRANQAADGGTRPGYEGGNGRPSQSRKLTKGK
jgi:hypothetical protein